MRADVRPGNAGDVAALLDLWAAAWSIAMPRIDFDARRPWLTKHLEQLQADGAHLLVAYVRDRPAGFVTVDPRSGTVDQLAVAVEWQGLGVGTQLLEAARGQALLGLRLSVNVDNAGAVAFYRKQGFEVVGEGINGLSGLPVLHMQCSPPQNQPRSL